MKKVFKSDEVAHIWASQSQSEGRNSARNIYFEGTTIYSYGSHFPLARFVNGRVLVTNRSYSVTTSKQLYGVRRAINHLESMGG